jgi:hypothetical protein
LNLQEQFKSHRKYLAADCLWASPATIGDLEESNEAEEFLGYEKGHRELRGTLLEIVRTNSSLTLQEEIEPYAEQIFESPFDDLDQRMHINKRIQLLIGHVLEESNIQFAERLGARLGFLFNAAKEENPDEIQNLPDSLSNFIAFLREMGTPTYPDVVLTPSNEIRAEWRTAPNRHFAVVFLPTGVARYVIFKPDSRDPDGISRLSGVTTTESLMDEIGPHGVLRWAYE